MGDIFIEPMIFENARTNLKTYGYRIYDDFDSIFCNSMPSVPENDIEILQYIVANATLVELCMMQYLKLSKKGVHIGIIFYDYEKIKDILDV